MNWLTRILRKLFRRDDPGAAFDREIAFHVETLTQDLIAQGIAPAEARRQALIEFGGREQVKQTVREIHISALAEAVLANLKAAMRFLRKSPTFSLAVILTLALGIGANSAVFSAIDTIMLQAAAVPQRRPACCDFSARLERPRGEHFVAPVRLEDWNRMNSTFQAISGYYTDDLSEISGPLPEKATEALVAPRFLQVMGVSPMLGPRLHSGRKSTGAARTQS